MIGYIQVSDSRKTDVESQREVIKAYAFEHHLVITEWIEEHVSTTTTELSERKLSRLIASRQSIIVSDITRLGRNKVIQLIGTIMEIAGYGELHIANNSKVINQSNVDDAEVIFTVVGQSYASAVEVQKRSERSKAAHVKRKVRGLKSGRAKGQKVKSKLDEHTAYILNLLDTKASKTEILRN
jgi:DNA invertase Pin-like site-specific DNA recombinase